MGSFSYTCAVSGLPIDSGDKVRYLLLTRNPLLKNSNAVCYPTSEWFPRVFPLNASYNDYGSVGHIDDTLGKQLWLDGFQEDLIEKEQGENEYHDVPTSKYMSFEALLNAVGVGRIFVKQATGTGSMILPVAQAMIREDVWQDLLTLRTEKSEYEISLAQRNSAARLVWNTLDLEKLFARDELSRSNEHTRPFIIDDVPTISGLSGAFRFAMKRKSEMSEDEISKFLKTAAELIYIQELFVDIRYAWRPSYSCGSQVGDWKTARKWHGRLAKISQRVHTKNQE